MTIRTLLCALVMLSMTTIAFADDASHAVMDHWVGTWTGGAVGAKGDPAHPAATPDHAEVVWTLDGKFLQGTNSDAAGKPVAVWMMRYDADDEEYKVYFFAADGNFSEWEGTWSEAEHKMTWEGEDEATGNDLSGYTQFNGNKQEWKLDVEQNGETKTLSGSLTRK